MKFGFSEQAQRCPRLRLLIYELVEEISHLSLFISFLQVIIFFLSLSPTAESNFPSSLRQRAKDQRVIENTQKTKIQIKNVGRSYFLNPLNG